MGTPYVEIFDAYLSKINDDLYQNMDAEEMHMELLHVLQTALPRFAYPKVDLTDREISPEGDEIGFTHTLSNTEIQIISTLMKAVWVENQIHNIYLLKQQFSDHDFQLAGTQAFHLRALLETQRMLNNQCIQMLHTYSKSKGRDPQLNEADFHGLAGGKRG